MQIQIVNDNLKLSAWIFTLIDTFIENMNLNMYNLLCLNEIWNWY